MVYLGVFLDLWKGNSLKEGINVLRFEKKSILGEKLNQIFSLKVMEDPNRLLLYDSNEYLTFFLFSNLYEKEEWGTHGSSATEIEVDLTDMAIEISHFRIRYHAGDGCFEPEAMLADFVGCEVYTCLTEQEILNWVNELLQKV